MTILYGFKLDANGRMMDRLFDHDKMPPDWYDSPDKVPGYALETSDHVEWYEAGPVEPHAVDALKRKGGRPKGSRNKVKHV